MRLCRILSLSCAMLIAAGCTTVRTVIQEKQVIVHDTVRVEVPYIPEKTYSDNWWGRTQRSLDSLCEQPLLRESQLGLCILDLTQGSVVYAHGERQRMRPASTMKIVTAVTAMTTVMDNADCFTLRVWADSTALSEGKQPLDITIAGGMDPLLDYNGLCALADSIVCRGIARIKDIRLDVSLSDTTRWGEGWCWDDENEAMTPFLYKGANAPRGGKGSSRQAWKQKPEQPFINDLCRALASRKIKLTGSIRRLEDRVPASGQTPIARIAHKWDEVLWPMMKNSNNQYAEAMLWQLGLLSSEPTPTLDAISEPFRNMCRQLGLEPSCYRLADGSGRSLYNYVTAELLCVLLNHAATQPWFETFRSSLPLMGIDGTLRKRCHDMPAQGNVQAKTGTVTGVVSLAGYAMSSERHLLCFAIINQGVASGTQGRDFQDSVCNILTR